MAVAWLNGEFLPLDEARIPALDRGFLLGDGVYEVLPAYQGRPFMLAAHIRRLKRSLTETRIVDILDQADWESMVSELVLQNGGGDQFIYIQVTRGVQAQRGHRINGDERPTVLAFCQPWPAPPPDLAENGVSCVLRTDYRWRRCDIKTTSLLPNVLLADEATREACNETILSRDGMITEGASSNVFVVEDGVMHTAPADSLILHGITRALVMALAEELGISVSETAVSEEALRNADEVMISSSTREIFPVTRIDDLPVGGGRPGQLWRQLFAAYQERNLTDVQ